MEIDLFHQLYEAFSEDDVVLLTEIAKLKLRRAGHLPAGPGPARKKTMDAAEKPAEVAAIDAEIEKLYKELGEDSLKQLGRQTP